MEKPRIEIRKPEHLMTKDAPKPGKAAPKAKDQEENEFVAGLFKFLLFMAYLCGGAAIWFAAQGYIINR